MIRRSIFSIALSLVMIACSCVYSFAGADMIVGVSSTGIYTSDSLSGNVISVKKLGDVLNVTILNGPAAEVNSLGSVVSGYVDKNDLIYSNTVYFAELPLVVLENKYTKLIDTRKYVKILSPVGLVFENGESDLILMQEATFLKLFVLAAQLEQSGYTIKVSKAYAYEQGSDYSKGSRIDITLWAGNTQIEIPKCEINENCDVVYSELEQAFIEGGFVRVDNSNTFVDTNDELYLSYEVDFDNLSYVILEMGGNNG